MTRTYTTLPYIEYPVLAYDSNRLPIDTIVLHHTNSTFVMKNSMFGKCHDPEIFNPVVVFNFIHVVYNFIFRKIPSYMFFHYNPMFKHISLFIGKWVGSVFNVNISVGMHSYTTFPYWIKTSILFPTGKFFKITSFTPVSYCSIKSLIAAFAKLNRRCNSALNTLFCFSCRNFISAFTKYCGKFIVRNKVVPSAFSTIIRDNLFVKSFVTVFTKLDNHIQRSLYDYFTYLSI